MEGLASRLTVVVMRAEKTLPIKAKVPWEAENILLSLLLYHAWLYELRFITILH